MLSLYLKRLIRRPIKACLFLAKSYSNNTGKNQSSQISKIIDSKNLSTIEKFNASKFRTYSQTDEDGILLYIFSLIGSVNKLAIEMCCGAGMECNLANLIINHGWKALLFDGNKTKINSGQLLYNIIKSKIDHVPYLKCAWLSAENINEIISEGGFSGEIDCLSIDIDGIDYWIWQSITCVNPRVVVIEYVSYWEAGVSVSVPYNASFERLEVDGTSYCGASLQAFVNLGKKLGYRLVGCNSTQFNAFFVRNDITHDLLPEVSVESCLSIHQSNFISSNPNKYPTVASQPWVAV
jgi:hypothetical protein